MGTFVFIYLYKLFSQGTDSDMFGDGFLCVSYGSLFSIVGMYLHVHHRVLRFQVVWLEEFEFVDALLHSTGGKSC